MKQKINQTLNIFTMLFLLLSGGTVFAHEQLLLVTAETMETPRATLQRYALKNDRWHPEGIPLQVNLGRNGLGWGLGAAALPHTDDAPQKHEGDGRAPAGIFKLGPVFGYAARLETAMPYVRATGDLICVDDDHSSDYNRLVHITPKQEVRSFEWMRREDPLYRMGIVVVHNPDQKKGRGSCIFLHVEKHKDAPTSGCTSMPEAALRSIIEWLDPSKEPLLVQLPRKSLHEIYKRFPGIAK